MTTTSNSSLRGYCPAPFFQADKFSDGGFLDGRLCQPTQSTGGNVTCCMPCPITDWIYADGFESRTLAANWVNVGAMCATAFLLLSYICLPIKWTHRHYLSVCLIIAVGFMELAFIVPLATSPKQCYDEITPNDMHTSATCAVTGSFLLFGGWAAVMWVFYRALSLHLQICWEVIPGIKFFYSALAFGWGVPAAGLALALSLTGVSFRFGTLCHINHDNGLADFWGPLMAFAAGGLIIQVVTLIYCIQVYVKALFDDKTTTETSSALPSYNGSVRTATARQAYRRVKRVIKLQWRGVAIVLLIIAWVVFFSIVFVSMDSNLTSAADNSSTKMEPWLLCLALNGGEKTECLKYVREFVVNEATIIAVLVCLASSGFFTLLFLGRWSMFLGWVDFFKSTFTKRNEFVSADARRLSHDHHTYEMLSGPLSGSIIKSPESAVTSPREDWSTPAERMNPLAQNAPNDYFGQDKVYTSPMNSFSTPRPPSSAQTRGWDPKATYYSNEQKF